ncbi:hypothetical protein C5Y96_05645 [Blastopirellula marina]|uniref:Uncharacterized protein n=2 Tax=Pirellulales TaxID=2691354 RepID=A0A2S8G4H5_9BACT|nr:hypothetical protein C5Y96_05645 [Blastopirellula marina]RCS55645.1 hypothetical protein DTL36_05655 [Bremerella cremea]
MYRDCCCGEATQCLLASASGLDIFQSNYQRFKVGDDIADVLEVVSGSWSFFDFGGFDYGVFCNNYGNSEPAIALFKDGYGVNSSQHGSNSFTPEATYTPGTSSAGTPKFAGLVFDYLDADNYHWQGQAYYSGALRNQRLTRVASGSPTYLVDGPNYPTTFGDPEPGYDTAWARRRHGSNLIYYGHKESRTVPNSRVHEKAISTTFHGGRRHGFYVDPDMEASFYTYRMMLGETAKFPCYSPRLSLDSIAGDMYLTLGSALTNNNCSLCSSLTGTKTLTVSGGFHSYSFGNCDCSPTDATSKELRIIARPFYSNVTTYYRWLVIISNTVLDSWPSSPFGEYQNECDQITAIYESDGGPYPQTLNKLDEFIGDACVGSFPVTMSISN